MLQAVKKALLTYSSPLSEDAEFREIEEKEADLVALINVVDLLGLPEEKKKTLMEEQIRLRETIDFRSNLYVGLWILLSILLVGTLVALKRRQKR